MNHMIQKFPVIFLHNCDPVDSTAYWLELKATSLEDMHQQVGNFLMDSLAKWHSYKKKTGREPHVHVEPKLLPRAQIDQLEVASLLNDDRTKRLTD